MDWKYTTAFTNIVNSVMASSCVVSLLLTDNFQEQRKTTKESKGQRACVILVAMGTAAVAAARAAKVSNIKVYRSLFLCPDAHSTHQS